MNRMVAVVLTLVVVFTPWPVSAVGSDWPQAGFDGGASRHNDHESTLRASNVDRLLLDWMRRIRPDVSFIYEYEADPSVVRGGRVFASWSGSEAPYQVVAAFDERTGARLWSVRHERSMQPIAASNSTLIMGVSGRLPSIVALDVATGATRWSRPAGMPLVTDRAVRHVIAVEVLGGERLLTSIDVTTGDRVWSRRLHVRLQGLGRVLLSHGLVVVPVWNERGGSRLVVLQADDGTTVWSQRTRNDPVVATDGLIFTTRTAPDGVDVIFETFSFLGGPILWSYRAPYFATIAVAGGGRVFVNRSKCISGCEGDFGSFRGSVTALDAATGQVLWRRSGNSLAGPTLWQAHVLANGLLFVSRLAYARGRFGALDPATGRSRWAATFGPRFVSASIDAVANGAVFGGLRFGERGGRIVRFALPPKFMR